MLKIDVLDSESAMKIFEDGKVDEARKCIINAIKLQFAIQSDIVKEFEQALEKISKLSILNDLHSESILCENLDEFKDSLSQAILKHKVSKKTAHPKNRGTDEAFLGLMRISGTSILKLLGVDPEEAEQYQFRAVALKEKRLYPDIEGLPSFESNARKVFIDFQGYRDPFIRYRVAGYSFIACSQYEYAGEVLSAIIYTDKAYQEAALPINAFSKEIGEKMGHYIKEIVLTAYTLETLIQIDPRLVVLAPYTIPQDISNTDLMSKTREWKSYTDKVYPSEKAKDEALQVMGLLILNRFRNITREELVAMLNFDILDTVAGRQLYDEALNKGQKDGWDKGLNKGAKKMLFMTLNTKFNNLPDELETRLNQIESQDIVEKLMLKAILCNDMKSFSEALYSMA